MRLWQHAAPRPPENVRIEYPDGTVVPVECRYDGQRAGVHQWTAVVPEHTVIRPGMLVRMDMLPAKTSVSLGLEDWAG